mgnify:CR=1 FL=1
MIIEIKIENKVVTINLLDKEVVLDSVAITEEHRLSEDLLPIIDELLKKHSLEAKDIEKMTLESDMGENFTTQRIAKAVVDSFNWAIANNK